MAKEIQAVTTAGLTLYAILINSVGQVWKTSGTPAFETYNGANWTDYDIALTEAGAGIYTANMPAVIAGAYSYVVYERAGVSPAATDTLKGTGSIAWSGTVEIVPAAAGAKMDLIDAPNGTAITAIQNGLSTFDQSTDTVKANLTEILATAISETLAGQIAAAFKKFFDEAAPTGDINDLPVVVPAMITAQAVRDAMKLAPATGSPTAGSVDAHLDSLIAGVSGAGAVECAITVNDGTNPVDGAEVWVTTDASGTNTVASGTSDALGLVTVWLDAGSYYVWKQLAGYTFTNPQVMVVT